MSEITWVELLEVLAELIPRLSSSHRIVVIDRNVELMQGFLRLVERGRRDGEADLVRDGPGRPGQCVGSHCRGGSHTR